MYCLSSFTLESQGCATVVSVDGDKIVAGTTFEPLCKAVFVFVRIGPSRVGVSETTDWCRATKADHRASMGLIGSAKIWIHGGDWTPL